MTEEAAKLALEFPKKLQGEFALMRGDMRGVRGEMTAIKQRMAAFMAQQVHQDSDVAMLKLRQDRIERRLDLVE